MVASHAMEPAVTRWREETPGCTHRVHLNNAGAGLMPAPVVSAIQAHIEREALHGGYEAAAEAADDVEGAYGAGGELGGARPANIAVVENATVAVAQALSAFDFRPGDVIVTTREDYVSNQLMLLSLAERTGVRVLRANDLPEGGVDADSVRDLLRRHPCRLVLMTWVPTSSGLVQDVYAVGELCAEAGVSFVLDACQAVGQLPIDVKRLRCDFLAATARKFLRGPRGIGFLYVSDRGLERGLHPLYIDLHGARWVGPDAYELEPDARRFENWEFAYALVLGLGAAARYALDVGIDVGGRRAHELATYARSRLPELSGVRVLDRGRQRCAIATAAVADWDARALVERLRRERINTSAVVREHALLDLDAKGETTLLRVSPHYYNTTDEIDALVGALRHVARLV
jgi:selenocysteine lyase/cysteine desulfurase